MTKKAISPRQKARWMRYLAAAVSLLFLAEAGAQGQLPLLLEEEANIKFEMANIDGQPRLNWAVEQADSLSLSLIEVKKLYVEGAGLVLDYAIKVQEKNLQCWVSLAIRDENGRLFTPRPWEQKGAQGKTGGNPGALTARWAGAMENVLVFNQPLTLLLKVEVRGDLSLWNVRCNTPPHFGFKNQLPIYAGAATGLGLIGIGQVYRSQADDEYQKYKDNWTRGRAEEQANPYLTEARDLDTAYNRFMIAGFIVLGADAAWSVFQYFKYRKRVRLYQKYCLKETSGIRFSPAFFPPSPGAPGGQAGFKVSLDF